MSFEITELKKIVEGAVLASAKPITVEKIIALFDEGSAPTKAEMKAAIKELKEDYDEKGIVLQEVASGLRFQVDESVNMWVMRLHEEKPQKYSRALLETIAIIAYRQPLTRGDIEDIRGVAVSTQIIKTLLEREWVRVVGHRDVPGRPALYATTRQFLDYFNLKNLDDLPPLSEIKDIGKLNGELELDDDLAQAIQDSENADSENADSEKENIEDESSNDEIDEALGSESPMIEENDAFENDSGEHTLN